MPDLAEQLAELAAEDRFSGVALVWQDGAPLIEAAAGLAHRGLGVPVTMATRFAVASVTKVVTASTVLALVGEGRFDLDTAVVSLVPEDLRPRPLSVDVTVHHLLSHTSGLGNYHDDAAQNWTSFTACWDVIPTYHLRRPADMLPLFAHQPARFAPGESWEYADANFLQLGIVVEHVTGERFGAVAERLVLGPAGCHDTAFVDIDLDPANVALGYRVLGEQPPYRSSIFSSPASSMTDGGMVTTAADLARLVDAIRSGHLLGPDLTALMLTAHGREEGTDDGEVYGYGIELAFDGDRLIRWGHGGIDPGYEAAVEHHVDLGVTVVVLCNVDVGAWPGAELALRSATEGLPPN